MRSRTTRSQDADDCVDLTVFDDNGRATKVVHVITAKQTFVFINGGPDGNRMDDDEIAFLRELPLTPF